MAYMTNMDLQALQMFARELETFKNNINGHCKTLESGIVDCQKFMLDDNSKQALRNSEQLCHEIRESLQPTQLLLEKVNRIIQIMNNMPTM